MIKNSLKFYHLICTFFGVGKIKFAPGTFGSLAALPVWFLFSFILEKLGFSVISSYIFWVIFLSGLFFLGVYYCDIHAKKSGKKDAGEIVIDEVVGQLIAVALSYYFVIKAFDSKLILTFYFLATFFLFRFFDILKPGLIGKADRDLSGGFGVMFDDVLAGFISALLINLLILIKLL